MPYISSRCFPTAFNFKTGSSSYLTSAWCHPLRRGRQPAVDETRRSYVVGHVVIESQSVQFYHYGIPGVCVADMLYNDHCQAAYRVMDDADSDIPSRLAYQEGTMHLRMGSITEPSSASVSLSVVDCGTNRTTLGELCYRTCIFIASTLGYSVHPQGHSSNRPIPRELIVTELIRQEISIWSVVWHMKHRPVGGYSKIMR